MPTAKTDRPPSPPRGCKQKTKPQIKNPCKPKTFPVYLSPDTTQPQPTRRQAKMLPNLLVQLINGLADASALFLVAAGLSLIFGVTRIVNFAHGSFYMLGVYVAYSIASRFGSTVAGFWLSMLAAALVVAVLGALVEVIVLRRIYQAPELFHLLATFALVLIFRDAALYIWGPEDLFGPRAPLLGGAVNLLGHALPTYDIALIVIGPIVVVVLWCGLTKTG